MYAILHTYSEYLEHVAVTTRSKYLKECLSGYATHTHARMQF